MWGSSLAHTSKLVIRVPTAPPANSMIPTTCVGVLTLMRVPNLGWLPTTRSGKVILAEAVTFFTGPSRFTRAVR